MNREITHREHASSEDSFDRAVVQVLVENPHIHLKEIDVSGSNPLLVARSEPWDSTKPTVFISAGIHGDEPAGVHAAVQFLNHGLPEYADRFNFVVMPCLNPDGFDTQTHNLMPMNINISGNLGIGVDHPLIRALEKEIASVAPSTVLACDLHEDNDEQRSGCYMYELLSENTNRIAHRMLTVLSPEDVHTDPIVHPDGSEPNDNGVIGYEIESNAMDGTVGHYLKSQGATHATTIETPSTWSLEKRVQSHLDLIRQGLESASERL